MAPINLLADPRVHKAPINYQRTLNDDDSAIDFLNEGRRPGWAGIGYNSVDYRSVGQEIDSEHARRISRTNLFGPERITIDRDMYSSIGEDDLTLKRDLKAQIVKQYFSQGVKQSTDEFVSDLAKKTWRSQKRNTVYSVDESVIRHVVGNLERNMSQEYALSVAKERGNEEKGFERFSRKVSIVSKRSLSAFVREKVGRVYALARKVI